MKQCLIKHHAMKTYRDVEKQLHAFSNSTLDAGERSASRPGRLIIHSAENQSLYRRFSRYELVPF